MLHAHLHGSLSVGRATTSQAWQADDPIDLHELLNGKRRDASMTARVLLTAAEILSG